MLLGDRYNSADIDLDCPEALDVASALLPPTGMIFGRKSKPASHWFYRSDPAIKTRQFKDPIGGHDMLVELRGRKKSDGRIGLQTVVPPSLHAETGELITFRPGCDRDPANVDAPDLVRAVSKVAAASLLARYWPVKGSRHDAMLALAGLLARAGWIQKETTEFCRALYSAVPTHDPEQIHRSAAEVADTYHKFSTNAKLTGFPTLVKLVDENVIKTVSEWLDLPKAAPVVVWSEDDLTLKLVETYPDLRYVDDWKRWLCYTPKGVWKKDNSRSVFDRAKDICRRASEGIDPKESATLKWLRSAKTRAAVENMARENRCYAAVPEQWDANVLACNTPKNTFNLLDGTMQPHRIEDYFTKSTNVSPQRGDTPLWTSFLEKITAGESYLQSYLQRVAGYCLTGLTIEHVLFFLYGTGANGKTTFTNTLLGIWGDYAQVASMETFTENKNDRHPTELAALRGARLVVASETEVGRRWAESRVKALSGGEPIRARFMHCDEFEYIPQFKLVIQGNHKPALRSVDVAIRRRLHMIPFTVTIPPEQRDRKLGEKLRAEWPSILQWAIDGCLAWQKQGLDPPETVRNATEDYFRMEDAILGWLEDRCVVSPQAATTRTSVLYQDFKAWAEQTGEFCGSQKRFSQDLMDRGFTIRESHGKVIDGISLRPQEGV